MSSGVMRKNTAAILAVAAFAYFMPAFASAQNTPPAPAEVKSIAEDAYIFAYPMLYGYQTLYTQTQDTFPRVYRRLRSVPSLCSRSDTCRSGHRHSQQRHDLFVGLAGLTSRADRFPNA